MAKAIDGPTTGLLDDRPLLVSMRKAAGLLGIGRSTLYELIERGEILPVRIGGVSGFGRAISKPS